MSLGKLTASLAAGSQEITVALAALNFDFSLFKTEAPKELQPLGTMLNTRRREQAEDGDIHSTARKLRAMFEALIPSTPNLYRAYGLRASEIAKANTLKQGETISGGAFVEHLGIDGGTIWAAATSGKGAIAIHLLACMLARVWSAPEATSIWEEIVSIRREELKQLEISDLQSISAISASKSAPTRQHLADWDASARAWLRAADDANRTRQRQLKLIIENVDLRVNNLNNVYDSVIAAWKSAMQVIDRLIEGMPHSIVDSSTLLAISAWHLYPDMLVLSQTNQFIRQADSLVDTRGILSLGLQSIESYHPGYQSEDMSRGITWSLPLAYYRFYGDPEQRERTLNVDASRISLSQLQTLAMGSYFSQWQEPKFNIDKASRILMRIWHCCVGEHVSRIVEIPELSQSSWLGVLVNAAHDFTKPDGTLRTERTRLFNYGRKRCPGFLSLGPSIHAPIIQLRDPKIMLSLMNTAATKLDFLRRTALSLDCDKKALMLRVAVSRATFSEVVFACAAVVPSEHQPTSITCYPEWYSISTLKERPLSILTDPSYDKNIPNSGFVGNLLGPIEGGRKLFWCDAPAFYSEQGTVTTKVDDFFGQFAEFALFKGNAKVNKPRVIEGVPFEFVFGDPTTAAIFCIAGTPGIRRDQLSAEDVIATLETHKIHPLLLLEHLAEIHQLPQQSYKPSKHMMSLKTLSTIYQTYEPLVGASIAMNVTSKELYYVEWMPSVSYWLDVTDRPAASSRKWKTEDSKRALNLSRAYEPLMLDLASTFACITMLESGTANLSSVGLGTVMAMSSGDSLFIANRLLQDPARTSKALVTRLRGNIGRAGIALLITPQNPRCKKIEPGEWNLMDENEFDGGVMDCFQNTSLHMSFTDYILPIDTGTRGVRDVEIYFLETVISVYDKGQWMGDLDIIPMFANRLLRHVLPCSVGEHRDEDGLDDTEMYSIDSWHEFLGRSEATAVFRAHGNWMARLAATSMSVSKGYLTLLFDDEVCWQCGHLERAYLRHKAHPLFII